MKQLTLNLRTGVVNLSEIPAPIVRKGHLLIKTHKSLISAGTEQMLVDFGKSTLLEKACRQPERLNEVWDKIRHDGVLDTFRTIRNRVDRLIPLGYCNVGEVIAVGEGVTSFKRGDRVISNGPHAQIVSVPTHLASKVPSKVADEDAAFTVPAAVALQSIRLLEPALGETVAVIGLGLIGQLTAQLLRINGCQVIGIEPDRERLLLAEPEIITVNPELTRVEAVVEELTNGKGVDSVIIAAAAKSNGLISQAAKICRKRGKIVLSGSVGMHFSRADFYKKELSFQVSCSYGAGRYDPFYEQEGIDYPYPYVRWTENRNFEAILNLLASGQLYVRPLVSKIVPLEEYQAVYQSKAEKTGLATLFDYDQNVSLKPTRSTFRQLMFLPTRCVTGVIGAGNYVRATMLPLLKGKCIKYIASSGGLSAAELAAKHNIPYATSDYQEILGDLEIDLVMIATQHHQHAEMVIAALRAGKHVFVEKPLAISRKGLDAVTEIWRGVDRSVTVGFNRRYSPYITKMRLLLGEVRMNIIITVNAGSLPENSWQHDPAVGGGRLIGEACHFIDLIAFLSQSKINRVCACSNGLSPGDKIGHADVLIQCENGSSGAIHYYSNGSSQYQKERVEVFSGGRTLILDDFSKLTGYGFPGFSKLRLGKQKGHKEQFDALFSMIEKGGEPLIAPAEIINVSKATFAVLESLKTQNWVEVE